MNASGVLNAEIADSQTEKSILKAAELPLGSGYMHPYLETSTFMISLRIRPTLESDNLDVATAAAVAASPTLPSDTASHGSGEKCTVNTSKTSFNGKVKIESETFEFDRVFGPTSTNEQVFEIVEPLIHRAIRGEVCTIFSFGQTGRP